MLKIPSQIVSLYDELLAKTALPVRSHFLYKKWLRYYLDFCHKYHFEPSIRQNISRFLNKLEEKNQNEQQKKQAAQTEKGDRFIFSPSLVSPVLEIQSTSQSFYEPLR